MPTVTPRCPVPSASPHNVHAVLDRQRSLEFPALSRRPFLALAAVAVLLAACSAAVPSGSRPVITNNLRHYGVGHYRFAVALPSLAEKPSLSQSPGMFSLIATGAPPATSVQLTVTAELRGFDRTAPADSFTGWPAWLIHVVRTGGGLPAGRFRTWRQGSVCRRQSQHPFPSGPFGEFHWSGPPVVCTAHVIEWSNATVWFVNALYLPKLAAIGEAFVHSFHPDPAE